ncbi:MAG TPA: ribosome biogenesis/translation initiation ATPase RLI [Thermoplasmata archaeon]|nr:ribosome biogenesis/translation initiation ATPase RLI [Thermoplasmata archaeon]
MRLAVINKKKCNPKRCSLECYKYCPRNRMGEKCIIENPKDGRPLIAEELCVGCGICVHKCPFEAIHIINLADELGKDLIHKFGENGFCLYRLPAPVKGQVVGLLGPNGIGKTTIINILSGHLNPNFGDLATPGSLEKTLEHFRRTELYNYFENFKKKNFKTSLKPQYVDSLPKLYKGKVKNLLNKVLEANDGEESLKKPKEVLSRLGLEHVLERDISRLSGGELQRLAIAATLLRDADVYFFDEPSSYLDIYQRMNMAKLIRELAAEKPTVVIEHDLAILDFLTDMVYILYGKSGAYGVVAQPRGTRHAINIYLSGYLEKENIRFRNYEIKFETHPPRKEWESGSLLSFPSLYKEFPNFKLETNEGHIHRGEVIGVVGPNATGKTTFVKMLAGVLKPTRGELWLDSESIKISYKPQYINPEEEIKVRELFLSEVEKGYRDTFFVNQVKTPLGLEELENSLLTELSGGELQRVAVALCLAREADIYLLDEPSAYLDSNQRMEMAKMLRRFIEKSKKSALVVDHDVYFIDIVSDSLLVFGGEPGRYGRARGPFSLREGMNAFLKDVGISFRRDPDTRRPRINKVGSKLDREQRLKGEYYYQ